MESSPPTSSSLSGYLKALARSGHNGVASFVSGTFEVKSFYTRFSSQDVSFGNLAFLWPVEAMV